MRVLMLLAACSALAACSGGTPANQTGSMAYPHNANTNATAYTPPANQTGSMAYPQTGASGQTQSAPASQTGSMAYPAGHTGQP